MQIENYGYLIHLILESMKKTSKNVIVELNGLLKIPSFKSPIHRNMLKNKYTTFFTVFPVRKFADTNQRVNRRSLIEEGMAKQIPNECVTFNIFV